MSDIQNQIEETVPVMPVIDEAGPPPVAGEPEPAPLVEPSDPDVVGALEPTEMMALNSLRQKANQLTFEMGNLELRKIRMVAQIEALEQQGQSVLNQVGKRLNLAEGTQWTLLQDGKVKLVK